MRKESVSKGKKGLESLVKIETGGVPDRFIR